MAKLPSDLQAFGEVVLEDILDIINRQNMLMVIYMFQEWDIILAVALPVQTCVCSLSLCVCVR